MQIVIEIDEEIFNKLPEAEFGSNVIEDVLEAVENGTVLPKGHGELIDRDKIEYLKAIHDAKYGYITWGDASKLIKYSAPTIIEADKAEKCGIQAQAEKPNDIPWYLKIFDMEQIKRELQAQAESEGET